MSVKLIAENILDADDFLSATEQEGERWGQPEAASDNEGSLRPVISGTPADFSYSGTATSDGAADNTTVVDSALAVYGDDYFIGATVAVTDFVQDTGDYTEEDVGAARVALTDANTVTVTNLDDDEAVWVVIDKTANHFDGNFEFHVDVNCTGTTGGAAMCGVWAVANTVDDIEDIVVANGDYLALYWHNAVAAHSLKLQQCNDGSLTTDTSSALSTSTQYYCRIVRDESVGTYGTLYCYIYSDASHETLVDTLSVTLTEKQDFRYLYWMIAKKAGSAGQEWNGVISNLEIVSSETQTVTDFAQATGTLTSAAFNYQVNTGTVFTLTLPYSTRDFAFELIASGDTGDATFKWSHDGGTTYFGRDSLNQADWLAEQTIVSGDAPIGSTNECALVQAQNGNVVLLYQSTTDDDLYRIISTDGGLTWGAASLIATMILVSNVSSAVCLPSGRLLCNADQLYYSDDDGDTWSALRSSSSSTTFYVLNNGALASVASLGTVYFYVSHDGGATIGTGVTVANDANDQANPVLVQADNGDIICAYDTNEDAVGDYEIKCKISTDNGATWGSAIDVLDFVASDIILPKLVKDLNGDIYCFATEQAADQRIVYSVSTDNGATWGAMTQVKTNAGVDLCCQDVKIVNGHLALCVYKDLTNQHYKCVRRGIWEAYSANACVCAPELEAQRLICGAEIEWYGGAGIAGDDWTFDAEYDYSMENLIEDSPSRPWRSEQDNIACNIVIDMGATGRVFADGAAFFGCNVRTLSVQMNATDAWTSPSVDELIDLHIGADTIVEDETGATWGPTYHGLSLADGQAFIRVEGVDLSGYADGNHLIRVNDGSKEITGYLSAAGPGEALGSELLSNPSFDANTTGWSGSGATLASVAGGQTNNCLEVTRTDGALQHAITATLTCVVGKLYKISCYVKAGTSGNEGYYVQFREFSLGTVAGYLTGTASGDWVQVTFYAIATSTSMQLDFVKWSATAGTMLFDTASVKEVTAPAADGALVTSIPAGSTRNWTEIESGFDYNDSAYTFDVYKIGGTGTLDSDSGANEIHDAALLANYKDHELAGMYLRFTSGTLSGSTFGILDNVDEYILCDGDTSSAATDDTFVIFQDKVAVAFTGGPYRYARIAITAQQTAENYYRIGSVVLGRAVTLTEAYDAVYDKHHVYDVQLLRTPAGGMIPIQGADRKRTFTLSWSYSDAGRREVLALLDYIQGKNIVLIPDSTDLTDVFLVKRTSNAEQEWWKGDVATMEVEFEEVL